MRKYLTLFWLCCSIEVYSEGESNKQFDIAAMENMMLAQFKLFESFCLKNAPELNNDYHGAIEKFLGYKFEKGEVKLDASLAQTHDMAKKHYYDKIFPMIVENNTVGAFCGNVYNKLTSIDRKGFDEMVKQKYHEYIKQAGQK